LNNFRKWAGDQFTISVRRGSRHLDDRTSALNGAVEAGGSGDVALQPAGTSLRRSASDISPPSATDAEGNPGAENNAPNDSSPATDAPRHRPCTRRPPRRPSAARTAMVANPSPASTWPRHPLDLLQGAHRPPLSAEWITWIGHRAAIQDVKVFIVGHHRRASDAAGPAHVVGPEQRAAASVRP